MWDNGKSVHEIAAFTNNSIAGVRNVLKTHSGFSKSASMARAENKRRKAVSQYDLNGDYIQTFGSVRAAAKACGVSHTCVLDACNGKGSIAGGYQWRFAGSDSPNQFSDRRKIKVNQYDLGGNFIATYNSIDEASRAINSNHKSILKCCMGLQHTAGGFQWRHSTETLLLHILAEGEKSSSAIWPVTKSMYSTPYRKRLRKVECTQTVSVLVALGGRNPLASLCGHMQIRGEAYCHSEIHVSALLRSNGEVYLAISLRSDLQTVLQYTCYFFC